MISLRGLMSSAHSFIRAAALCVLSTAAYAQDGGPSPLNDPYNAAQQADVLVITVQADGSVITAGQDQNGGSGFIRRFQRNGTAFPGFTPPAVNGAVNAVISYTDGSVLIAGEFSTITVGNVNFTVSNIARLKPSGAFDDSFDFNASGADGPVRALLLQTDGKILLGGSFTTVGGTARKGIARINAKGGLDATFAPGTGIGDGEVDALAFQAGQILVGGTFTTFAGANRPALVRLTGAGVVDATFDAKLNAGSKAFTLVPLSDGRLLVGGNVPSSRSGITGSIFRLNANGTVDFTFLFNALNAPVNGAPNPAPGGDASTAPPLQVRAILVQDDGRYIVGGAFDKTINGAAYHNLARLNPDGSLDDSLRVPSDGTDATRQVLAVRTLAFQLDGSLLVGTFVPPFFGRNGVGFPIDPIVNIIANAVGVAQFSDAVYRADAAAGKATITVRRSFSRAGSVTFTTADGSALGGRDYQPATGTISWAEGDSSNKTFDVVLPNTSKGGDVKLMLTSHANGVTINALGSQATLTVAAAPATPTPTPTPGPEPTRTPTPTPGPEPTRTPTPTPGPEPTRTPTPIPGAEPTPTPTPVPGTEPTRTPTPAPGGEPTPTPVPGGEPTRTPTPTPPPVEMVAVVSVTVSGDGTAVEGGKRVKVTFTRTGDVSRPVNVAFLTKGTAQGGVDFEGLPGKITIPAGETSVTLKIKQVDDRLMNGSRTLVIRLQPSPRGKYLLGDPKKVVVQILDND